MSRRLSPNQMKHRHARMNQLAKRNQYIDDILKNTGLRYELDYEDANNEFYQSRQTQTIINMQYDDIDNILATYDKNQLNIDATVVINNFDILIQNIIANNQHYQPTVEFDYQMILQLQQLAKLALQHHAADQMAPLNVMALERCSREGFQPMFADMFDNYAEFKKVTNDPLADATDIDDQYNQMFDRALNEIAFIAMFKNIPKTMQDLPKIE